MRASRLISILTLLQARGRVTAPELSAECAVSLRTVYRDIDALSAAGVPVYSERGAEGGYRLLDGYRTKLNGLSAKEAEALFMIGLSGPAADLGIGGVMAAAQNKLLAAMPSHVRAGAELMQSRFHLDAPAWFAQAELPDHLRAVAGAVWEERAIRIRYQSWQAEKLRVVHPLGLVLKSGAWYLAGMVGKDVRTYRVSRILDLEVTAEGFARPRDFKLSAYWQAATRRLDEELHQNRASVRFSPLGLKMIEAFVSPYVATTMQVAPRADADGWTRAEMHVGSVWQTCSALLPFGADAEIIEPLAVREAMQNIIGDMQQRYAA